MNSGSSHLAITDTAFGTSLVRDNRSAEDQLALDCAAVHTLNVRTPCVTPVLKKKRPRSQDENLELSAKSQINETSRGNTPLDKLLANSIARRRVEVFRRFCTQQGRDINTPVKISVQRKLGELSRLSVIQENESPQMTPYSKRRRVTQPAASSVRVYVSPSPNLDSERGMGSAEPITESSPTTKLTESSGSSIPTVAVRPKRKSTRKAGSEELAGSSCSTQASSQVGTGKSKGSSTLLGSKAVPKNRKRYISRVAVNQKTKRTIDSRTFRAAYDRENGIEHEGNKKRWERKRDRIEGYNIAKFVENQEWTVERVVDIYPRKDLLEIPDGGFNREYLLTIIREEFGLDEFREGQYDSISRILKGGSLLVSLPTGSGKSLIYQLTGYVVSRHWGNLAIVVCPTLALVDDQYNRLVKFQNLNVARLFGGMKDYRRDLVAIYAGVIDVLVTTPEQLVSYRLRNYLSGGRKIGLLCIDEAHCLSEWGHSFRPAYQQVLDFAVAAAGFEIPRILMLTATASQATIESILALKRDVQIFAPHVAKQRQDLIKNVSIVTSADHQVNSLIKVAEEHTSGICIVYVWMQWMAEEICRQMASRFPDKKSLFYHSNMDHQEKTSVTNSFINGQIDFIITTQALGIGIDSKFVTKVIHLNMPSSIEQYVQEIGRANRLFTLPKVNCNLLLNFADYRRRFQQIYASKPDKPAILHRLATLFNDPKNTLAIKQNDFAKFLNCRSMEETEVLVTLFDRISDSMNQRDENLHHVTNEADDLSKIEIWWKNRTKVHQTCRLYNRPIYRCRNVIHEAVQIKCYKKLLEDLADECPLVKFLKTFWTKNSASYKIEWKKLLDSDVNIDVIDEMLRDVAPDHHLSVTGLYEKCFWFVRGPDLNETKRCLKVAGTMALDVLERNHKVQVNRIQAALIAFLRSSPEDLNDYLHEYFLSDPENESLEPDIYWKKNHEGNCPLDNQSFHR